MTSTITLYYNCLVEKEKNFILDNPNGTKAIETYLATLTSSIINNVQYVKQKLNLTIKLDMSQTGLNMGTGASDLNYVKIQNDAQNPYYYFVDNKRWVSENTIELVLQMDTLNTFRFNSDYIISEKTLVQRMHKDRFSKIDKKYFWFEWTLTGGNASPKLYTKYKIECNNNEYYGYIVDDSYGYYTIHLDDGEDYSAFAIDIQHDDLSFYEYDDLSLGFDATIDSYEHLNGFVRQIDLKSENISAPTYKISDELLLERNGIDNIHWSLYYKTADMQEGTPVDCYLIPDTAMSLYYQQNAGELNNGNVPTNKYLIFASTYPNGALSFDIDGNVYSISAYDNSDEKGYRLIAVQNDGGTIKVYSGLLRDSIYIGFDTIWTLIYTGNINVMNAPSTLYCYETSSLPNASTWFNSALYLPAHATKTISMGSVTQTTLYGNSTIDKTLEENIKIINIPYSPTEYSVDSNGVFTFASCWSYNSGDGKLKLTDFTYRFKNHITSQVKNILENYVKIASSWKTTSSRYLKDSKLYHSDYFRPKFVYDNFSKVFPLEELKYEDVDAYKFFFEFNFIMSRNIVSKFLFKFDYVWNHPVEDYENIVAVSRNNEEVLYNSQYLNYIRTGYNYDLKAKEKQEVTAGVGIGLNVAGFLASIGIGVATQNPIAIGSAVATGISLVSQMVNYAKTISQNEDNIQRKLLESQRQAVSVLNADDYDLLYSYSENRAKLCKYKISSQMEAVLDDLFYYGGYIINEQMIPSINSRYWFNFVQASLVIDETNNLTEEIVNNIKEKFNAGVTFIHYRNSSFNFAQDKENIEVSLLS